MISEVARRASRSGETRADRRSLRTAGSPVHRDDQIVSAQSASDQPAAPVVELLLLQLVHQVKHIEEPGFLAVSDALPGDGNGQMRFAGAGAADHDHVGVISEKVTGIEVAHLHFVDRGGREVKAIQVLIHRELRQPHAVADAPDLPLGQFRFQKVTDNPVWCRPALDSRGQDLVESSLHPIQAEGVDGLHQLRSRSTIRHLPKAAGRTGNNPPPELR
jgi:hypothetical protein